MHPKCGRALDWNLTATVRLYVILDGFDSLYARVAGIGAYNIERWYSEHGGQTLAEAFCGSPPIGGQGTGNAEGSIRRPYSWCVAIPPSLSGLEGRRL